MHRAPRQLSRPSRRPLRYLRRNEVDPRFDDVASLVKALVSDDPRLNRAAYARLRGHVLRCRHPAVRRASPAEREEIVQEVALHITREPARVAAASIYSWNGLSTAIARWIDHARGNSVEDRPDAWSEHVWHKLGSLLLRPERFVCVSHGRTARYALAHRPLDESGLDPEALAARLPAFPPRLASSRDDQLGEVISHADLAALVTQIFTLGGNVPRTRRELTQLVLASLSLERGPACETLEPSSPVSRDGAAEVEARLEARDARHLAGSFVRSLAPRTLRAACIRFGGGDGFVTLERVALALAVSRGTAENEVGDTRGRFGAELRAWCEAHDLDGAARDGFVYAVMEILAATPNGTIEDVHDVD